LHRLISKNNTQLAELFFRARHQKQTFSQRILQMDPLLSREADRVTDNLPLGTQVCCSKLRAPLSLHKQVAVKLPQVFSSTVRYGPPFWYTLLGTTPLVVIFVIAGCIDGSARTGLLVSAFILS
jgi:hypothetical protein